MTSPPEEIGWYYRGQWIDTETGASLGQRERPPIEAIRYPR